VLYRVKVLLVFFSMTLENYHTHTYRCKHAEGDIKDYIAEALACNFTALGFSDHMPHPQNIWEGVRMGMGELKGYCTEVRRQRQGLNNLKVFLGLECEYEEGFKDFYCETLFHEYQVEYLVCGMHWVHDGQRLLYVGAELETLAQLKAYVISLAQAMESGLFSFIAHPDLFFGSFRSWNENTKAASKEILLLAEQTQIPLEINCLGFRKEPIQTERGLRPPYPLDDFWEMAASYRIRVVVNSDAHRPQDLSNLSQGLALVQRYNLQLAQLDLKKIKPLAFNW